MNKSGVPTSQKIMIPLRLPPKTYNQLIEEVQKQKKINRGYSVNEYLTNLLIKELENNKL